MNKRESIIWAAGLFEGEGCIHIQSNYIQSKQRGRPLCKLSMASTDKDTIDKFVGIVEHGKVTGPYYPKGCTKPTYVWSIASRANVYCTLAKFYPFLGNRRRAKAKEGMELIVPVTPQNVGKRKCHDV